MKSVGRKRREPGREPPGCDHPSCLSVSVTSLFSGLPLWLLSHSPLPVLLFPPLTASPPIPHASLSQLSRLPSVSHLPFLSPTCPLNFIYKRAARLPFNGSPCAPAVQPSQKPRLHRTFQTDSKGRLVRQKTGAENWDGESRLPSPIHRMGHLSTRA